jgi:hypothetical protein
MSPMMLMSSNEDIIIMISFPWDKACSWGINQYHTPLNTIHTSLTLGFIYLFI